MLDDDDRLLWEAGQADVCLTVNEKGQVESHLKFKKDTTLFGYLTWLIRNRKI